jgi:Uncharacterised protein family (UPF0172)
MGVPTTVTTTSQASLAIALHCIRHATDSVHGVLLGFFQAEKLVITDAVPVTHGAPTLPIVEAALGLLPHCMKSNNLNSKVTVQIVGWYTAPMLSKDTKPSPLALRLVANLSDAKSSLVISDPILLVVQNETLASFLKVTVAQSASFIKAYTKDSSNQWLKPIGDNTSSAVTIQDMDQVFVAVQKAKDQGIVISDLIDFYDECSAHSSGVTSIMAQWYPNEKVAGLL